MKKRIAVSQKDLKLRAGELLRQIDPKKQPYGSDFFEPLSRLIVNIGIEAVFLRFNPKIKSDEVLLRKRAENETYPGQWHVPGSLIRYGENFDDVFERILNEECRDVKVSTHQFIGFNNNTGEARGHTVQIVYCLSVEYNGKPEAGSCAWFSVNKLPESIVDHHAEIVIPMVVKSMRGK